MNIKYYNNEVTMFGHTWVRTSPTDENKSTESAPESINLSFECYMLAKGAYELLQKLDFQIENADVWLYRHQYRNGFTVYFAVPDIAPHYGHELYARKNQFAYLNGNAIFSPDYKKKTINNLNFNVQGGMEDLQEIIFEKTGTPFREIPQSGIEACREMHERLKVKHLKSAIEVLDNNYESPRP